MKKFILLMAISASFPAYCKVSSDVLCFSSGGDKPIQFEFRTFYDDNSGWAGGFVKYRNSKSFISLTLESHQEESFDKNYASLMSEIWLEVSNRKITGEYEMEGQGTNINSMIYKNFSSGKKYYFIPDQSVNSTEEAGCDWRSH